MSIFKFVKKSKGTKIYKKIKRAPKSRVSNSLYKSIRNIAVKSVMKKAETKQVSQLNNINFNSSIDSTAEFYSLIPGVAQGNGDAQRIGQKITANYLKIKGFMSYEIQSLLPASNNLPIYVDIFIFSDKIQKSMNQPAYTSKILNNSGTMVNYSGIGMNSCLPFNTEDFKLVKRIRKKLSYAWAPGNTSTGIIDQTAPVFGRFSCNIPVKGKQFDYETSGAVLPQNVNYWMAVGFTQYTDTVQTATPLKVQWCSTLYYKDL